MRLPPWGHDWKGRLDEHALDSEALTGNPLGDPHRRPLYVYTPPGYDDDADRRPATVMFADLSGFTALSETLDPEDVRALQTELKRVGCDPGSLDGNWGGKSRHALERFQRLSKLSLPSDEPTEAALQSVAGQMGRICPSACEAGETEVNGSCVAKPRPQKRKTVTRPARQNTEQPSSPGFRVCVGGRALGLCTN